MKGVNKMINLYYQARDLVVEQVIGENEFDCIKEDIRPNLLNIIAADTHVSTVERSIRAIKERRRCQGRHPRVIVTSFIIFTTKALNNKVGMSKLTSEVSPNLFITGKRNMKYD